MTKQQLRQRLLVLLRRQPGEARLAKSLIIAGRLKRLRLYRRAEVLLCYVAMDGEVETRPILAQALADGKRVAVPVTFKRSRRLVAAQIKDLDRDLKAKGPFGILQPTDVSRRRLDPKELDLVLVPGVAFDAKGRRLGRGGGYFDRFLEKLPPKVPRVGLAFHFQLVKEIPWEPHDRPVSRVITDRG